MKSVYSIIFLILSSAPFCLATHYKGGEIQASQVSGQTYNIRVRIYLDIQNAATTAQQSVLVCFGDGSTKEFPRANTTNVGSGVAAVDFDGTHTYSSSGIFQISATISNRSSGYLNYPNSSLSDGFLWTVIDTHVSNTTPILPYLLFEGGVRQVFSVDLKPTTPDADSISVQVKRLSKASPGSCGVRMIDHDYMFPNEVSSSGIFKVDPALKQLIWKAPEIVGGYMFAMVVNEWRDGVKISETYREGSINIVDKPGQTVVIPPYESSEYGNPITAVPGKGSVEISMSIHAYPVPTNDFVNVKALSNKRAIIRLQLIDLNGRIIREATSKSPEISLQEQFDMRNLASGVYLIRADNSIDVVSQKVVR